MKTATKPKANQTLFSELKPNGRVISYRQTLRNHIKVPDALPARWHFLSGQHGSEWCWRELSNYIDTVAEHMDALATGNGIEPEKAIDQAIRDLIKEERANPPYTTGDYWKLTPTHQKAILAWYKETP